MLLPFGGYKGAGIAMMIELLAAGLIGERFSFEAAAYDNRDMARAAANFSGHRSGAPWRR